MSRPAGILARGWGWRHAGRRRWAVADLDLRIDPGERVLLLGASGSGKSTLLRGLSGVLGDAEDGESAGELIVDGEAAADARGRVGLVLQDPDAQVILARVGDDVAFGCENLGVPRAEIWPRVHAALDAVGLDAPLDRSTGALSGGQKQRLALAGIVAMQPGLILLDEPTANLDPDGVIEVRDAVLRAREATGATLLVVEHRVDIWAAHVDRVVVLADGGGVLADGAPHAVFGAHAQTLTEVGVWVPGVVPTIERGSGLADVLGDRAPEGALLAGHDLAVGRRRFGERDAAVAISGVEIELQAGRARAITGPNGVGKSTLALTLAGLLEPVAGAVIAAESLRRGGEGVAVPSAGPPRPRRRGIARGQRGAHEPGPDPRTWTSRQLLTRICTVFQDPEHQLLARSVRAELEIGPRALGLTDDEVAARVEPLLERLRLLRLQNVNPFTLSGGEKRRLTVASALATRPRLLVLDEPTYGQDARTWRELAGLIAAVRDAGTGVAFVTHDLALVDALADDVTRLGLGGQA